MRLLARYLAQQVLVATGFLLLALLVLFAFFDVMEELGSLGRNNYGLGQAAVVVLLSMPGHLYEILPVAALIGTLFALSRLVGNSEYAVMRVSGLSNWRVAGYFAVIGAMLALLALLVGEYVTPWSDQTAQRYKLSATRSVVAQQFRSGLWVKDGTAFINVREVMPDNTLRGIEIYGFDAGGRLGWIRAAAEASWHGNQTWSLQQVVETRFDTEGIHAIRSARQDWQSVLTRHPSDSWSRRENVGAHHLAICGASQGNGQKPPLRLALWTKYLSPIASRHDADRHGRLPSRAANRRHTARF